jgi:hypothetical protein
VRVYATSTHAPISWTVNFLGTTPISSSSTSKIFSTTLDNLPMGVYEIQVTACFSYKFPDGINLCQTKGKFVSFVVGQLPASPGTIETSGSSPALAQVDTNPCGIDFQRSVACNSKSESFEVQSSRM